MIEARAQFVTVLDTSVRGRVLNAEPISLLSNHDDKLVEVVRDINDTRFVRRSYSQAAVAVFEGRSLLFTEALTQMCQIFEGAGIGVVPHVLFQFSPEENQYPVVLATEYLEDDIQTASTEAKVQVATALGAILSNSSKFRPGLEIFSHDMFRVRRDPTGSEKLVLVDIDPFLRDKFYTSISEDARDIMTTGYIKQVSSLLWDSWCRPDERGAVIGAFVRSLASQQPELDLMSSPRATEAIMTAHTMAQGIDIRTSS